MTIEIENPFFKLGNDYILKSLSKVTQKSIKMPFIRLDDLTLNPNFCKIKY